MFVEGVTVAFNCCRWGGFDVEEFVERVRGGNGGGGGAEELNVAFLELSASNQFLLGLSLT